MVELVRMIDRCSTTSRCIKVTIGRSFAKAARQRTYFNPRHDQLEGEWLSKCMSAPIAQCDSLRIHVLGTLSHSPRSRQHIEHALYQLKPVNVGVWYNDKELMDFHSTVQPKLYGGSVWHANTAAIKRQLKINEQLLAKECGLKPSDMLATSTMGVPWRGDLNSIYSYFQSQKLTRDRVLPMQEQSQILKKSFVKTLGIKMDQMLADTFSKMAAKRDLLFHPRIRSISYSMRNGVESRNERTRQLIQVLDAKTMVMSIDETRMFNALLKTWQGYMFRSQIKSPFETAARFIDSKLDGLVKESEIIRKSSVLLLIVPRSCLDGFTKELRKRYESRRGKKLEFCDDKENK